MLKTVWVGVLWACCFYCCLSSPSNPQPAGPLDQVITNALEDLRLLLKNITIADQYLEVNQSGITVNLNISNIVLDNVSEFNISKVATTLIPLEIKNLTLTWNYLAVDIIYALDGVVDLDMMSEPIDLSGGGKARLYLEETFVTAGAKIRRINESIQIPEGGLYGLDLTFASSNFTIENLLDSPEVSEIAGGFVSYFIKLLVDDFKPQIIDAVEPVLMIVLNNFLADLPFP